MVEYVSKYTLQFHANAFRHNNILPHAEVHVPVGQAEEIAIASVLVVYTKNRITEVANGRYALLEQIDRQRTGGVVVIGVTGLNGPNLNGVFIAEEVDVVTRAVLLAVPGRRKNLNRFCTASGEHGRERPAAQCPSHETMLSLEERGLVDEERVVDELAIIILVAVSRRQIERVIRSNFAAGLDHPSSSQRLGPGEVRLQRQSSPVGHLEGSEAGIVVSVTYAAVAGNARRELAGVVQHGGPREWAAAAAAGDSLHWAAIQVTPQTPHLSNSEVMRSVG